MKKFICNDVNSAGQLIKDSGCGEIDYYLMDGYSFGDRILEGVMFKVFYDIVGDLCVDTVESWDENGYLAGLNKEYWLEMVLSYAKNNDIGTCLNCENDICAEVGE